jgi:hypothetical protein
MASLVEHVRAQAAHYGQNGLMIHMMAQQALLKAGREHRVLDITEEDAAIIDAELERRLGGKRVNGKRVN